MRFSPVLVLIFTAVLSAQTPAAPAPAEPSPETVIASFDGHTVTYGQLKGFVIAMAPPEQQQLMLRMPALSVHKYFLWLRLGEMAEQEKLDQKSPTKEQLYWGRMSVLMQAKLNDMSNQATADEESLKKYYEAHKDNYTQIKVKAIYVSFSSTPVEGKKVPTEAEAKARIEKILAEIRGGADFVKMVKQYSEDATSREKDGDLETFRKSDNIPDAIRAAVFKLKQGEVSEPVRQPNGFYLFRAEQVTTRTYQQVQSEIYDLVRQENFKHQLDQIDKGINFKVEDPAYFKASAAAPPPAGPVPAAK